MKPITSIFNFYQMLKSDERYKLVCQYTNKSCMSLYNLPTWEKAQSWMEGWLSENNSKDHGCSPMVQALNDNIHHVVKSCPNPIPPPHETNNVIV